MTFWRTLEYAFICALLISVILASSFLGGYSFFIIVSVLTGFVFYYLFKELPTDEAMEEISIAYIPASIVAILSGVFNNLILDIIETINQLRAEAAGTQFGSLATMFAHRNIAFELIVLIIGLFGPFIMFKLLKSRQIEYERLVWNILAVTVVYLIIALIVNFVIWPRLVGPVAVL